MKFILYEKKGKELGVVEVCEEMREKDFILAYEGNKYFNSSIQRAIAKYAEKTYGDKFDCYQMISEQDFKRREKEIKVWTI